MRDERATGGPGRGGIRLGRSLAILFPVATTFARRAARIGGSCPTLHCFEKATFAQVLANVGPLAGVESRWRRAFKAQLAALQKADLDAIFEMKKVDAALRPYFNPLSVNVLTGLAEGHRVLLADDILGSGTSMRAAYRALLPSKPLSVTGLTFLGKLA